jgi:hypothetical protein
MYGLSVSLAGHSLQNYLTPCSLTFSVIYCTIYEYQIQMVNAFVMFLIKVLAPHHIIGDDAKNLKINSTIT